MKTAIIILSLALIVVSLLYWKSCTAPVKTFDTSKYDSSEKVKDSIANYWHKQSDFFEDLASFWRNHYDSINSALSNSVAIIKLRTDSIRTLVISYNKYKKENDTLKQLVICSDLVENNDILLNLLDSANHQLDLLRSSGDSVTTNLQNQIEALKKQITTLQEQVMELNAEIRELLSVNSKLAKKEKFKDIIAKAEAVALAAVVLIATFKK